MSKEENFIVECATCKQHLENWFGSTPCCGSIAYLIEDGKTSEKITLFASVNGGNIEPKTIDLSDKNAIDENKIKLLNDFRKSASYEAEHLFSVHSYLKQRQKFARAILETNPSEKQKELEEGFEYLTDKIKEFLGL